MSRPGETIGRRHWGLLVLTALSLGFPPGCKYDSRKAFERRVGQTCRNNVSLLQSAASAYAADHGGEPPASPMDVVPQYILVQPICPEDGDYLFDLDGKTVRCTVHNR